MSVATGFAIDFDADCYHDLAAASLPGLVPDSPPPGLRVAGRPGAAPRRRPVSARPPRPGTVSVLHAPSTPDRCTPVRLTRRGVAVVAAAVAVLGAALVWLAAAFAPVAAPAAVAGPATVTVQSGDTLWSIAARVAPQRDPRAEISTLQRLNHLDPAALVPGQQLRVR
ncbi:MAG TPA: LysM peptidoglycan-binding domain-containing protein [Jatrophihabitans sp.]|jgi:LysM repeat protein|uniref:LysM peptidoglycan-binding domain-containing protein n=1 Tax=Jatrophihabitans sp. TaxID=1932789 RepID=UPI002E0B68BF|nr:LysM peptidoglycan-binding domain-containing protein [Jatrophihabitans sp.]